MNIDDVPWIFISTGFLSYQGNQGHIRDLI